MKTFLDAQMKYQQLIVNSRPACRAVTRRATWARIAVVGLLAIIASAVPSFGQIVGTAQLNFERRGHTATLLEDGRVLIIGGDNLNEMVSQAEIFDPVAQTSSLTATLSTARTDHTASRLGDGRVLVVGGRGQSGGLTSSEIFDPVTATFTAGPSMTAPRSGHTATALANGNILVAGGDASGSAEIYNLATQTFSPIAANMTAARKFHSAILTSSGQVLIVGGVNAQNAMLNTAEVFDPASQSFYIPPTDMQTQRALATLKLLPDGKVQIIGGDAELSMEVFDPTNGIFIAKALLPPNANLLGATLSTQSRAALFSPSISQDPLLQGVLTPEQLALLDRADQSITELPARNQALITGGINSAGQILNSATIVNSSSASVTTDKTDYAPGQIVTITGSGFQPNEQVDIYFHEFPEEYPDIFLSAGANQQGNFVTAEFAPQEIDLGRIFTLTAIGQTSGFTAQTAFKDARLNTISVTGQNPNPVTAGSNVSFTVTVGFNATAASCTVDLSISGLPVGASLVSFSPNPVAGSGVVDIVSTLTISTNTTLSGGTYSFQVAAATRSGCQNHPTSLSTNGNLVVVAPAAAPTNLQVSAAIGTYDGSVNLSATLTKSSDSSAVSGKLINFSLNGTSIGSANTNASGVAILSGVSLAGINAATYPNGVGASFAGDSGFQASNGTNSLTVNKKDATWTTSPASKTYGDPDPIPLTTGSGSGFVDAVTATYSRVAGETVAGSPYHITATLSAAAGVLDNYIITNNGADFIINKRNATWTTSPASKTYGDPDPIPLTTGSGSGFVDAVTATYSRVAGETVAGSPYHITATLSAAAGILDNYNITNNGADFTINKRPITITADAKGKFYGDADPALTYQITSGSLKSGDTIIGALTRAAGENVGTYAIGLGTLAISDGNSGNNYDLTFVGALLTINKRPITITADAKSKIYTESDPPLTYQITSGSLAFSDAFTGALSRVTGELVGMYAIQQNTLSINNIGNYTLTYIGANLTITTGFAFNGFHSPIGGSVENGNGGSYANPLKTFKLASTIPVKFGATWLNGGAALITGIHTLQAVKYSNATDSEPPIDATPTDAATTGNQFRLTSTDWHFNLSTKGSGFSAGTWLLIATLQDGSKHTVWITIKK